MAQVHAIFIGDQNTYDYVRTIKPQWNWREPITDISNIDSVFDVLETEPVPDVIMVSDHFYTQAYSTHNEDMQNNFFDIVATSNQTLLIIFDWENYNIRQTLQSAIEQHSIALKEQERQEQLEDPTVEVVGVQPYYWVESQRATTDLDTVIEEYVNSETAVPQIVNTLMEVEGYIDDSTDDIDDHEVIDSISDTSAYMDAHTSQESSDIDLGEEVFTNARGVLGELIVSTSSKGGAGKTNTAMGVAQWLSSANYFARMKDSSVPELKVCVIDLDTNDAQIETLIDQTNSSQTILNVIAQHREKDSAQGHYSFLTIEDVEPFVYHRKQDGLSYMLAPHYAVNSASIKPEEYNDVVKVLRHMFDIVVVDTSVNYSEPLFRYYIYPQATAIILVTTLDDRSILGCGKWIIANGGSSSLQGSASLDLGKVKIVVNRASASAGVSLEELTQRMKSATDFAYSTYGTDTSGLGRPEIVAGVKNEGEAFTQLANKRHFELIMTLDDFRDSMSEVALSVVPEGMHKDFASFTKADFISYVRELNS